MRNITKIALLCAAAVAPASALAHPGPHRLESVWSLLHAFSHVDPLLVAGAGLAALAAVTTLLERKNREIVAASARRAY